jgi:nitrate reductase NapAB chaperone NapD
MAAEHSAVLEAKKAMRTQIKKQLKAMSPAEMREQSEAASSKS